ncbi:MAG: hypothetical protein KBS81_00885 [Spirochaetales bacterium]|nr:hypothetical protein [Candidatus Physcosoma equi]
MDPLLLVVVIIVGIFVYYAAFKGIIYLYFFPLMAASVALWYFCTFYLSEKMVRKVRGDEKLFFQRAQMIDEKKNELITGALVVTESEMVFYKRKGYKGGLSVVWSCFTNQIESYSMCVVDDHHKGMNLNLRREKKPVRFCSAKLMEREKEFRSALGWPEE